MNKNGSEKYCLDKEIRVVWIDMVFGLAKVWFVEEKVERLIGIKMITDKPYTETTLSINVLAGRIQ